MFAGRSRKLTTETRRAQRHTEGNLSAPLCYHWVRNAPLLQLFCLNIYATPNSPRFYIEPKNVDSKTETQRRNGAKTQRIFFRRSRASASSLRERRSVGACLGKQACLPLYQPFGCGLRPATADHGGGIVFPEARGIPQQEPGCTRSVSREKRGEGHELAHGDRFSFCRERTKSAVAGLDSGGVRPKTFAPLRLCVKFFLSADS